MKNLKNIKIGWIGTGVMGSSMCKHLLKQGYSLSVFNRTVSKTEELQKLGAELSNPLKIAKESDYVFLMLGYPHDVESMVFGNKDKQINEGILHHMNKGSYLVDHTSSSPTLAERIYDESKNLGVHSYDAPVTEEI